MQALSIRFRKYLWAAFLAHQACLFLIAIVFLTSVRRITGRDVHLGNDPIGLADGAALVVLSIGVVLLTQVFYRWIKGAAAPSLGISLSPRRFMELVAGLVIGWAFFIAPWAGALWLGTASIHDRITSHVDSFSVVRILTVAFLMLLLQAVMEETSSRAFPMRLWEHRSLAFRMIVTSIFFVAIHLVSEQFDIERAGILFMAGILQSIAYVLTGNIWLASGLHAGANIAMYSIGGVWHAGAVVALTGQPTIPHWVTGVIMLAVFGGVLAVQRGLRKTSIVQSQSSQQSFAQGARVSNEFCGDVKRLIGDQLRQIGATHLKDTCSGEGINELEVCYFTAANKVIAIPYALRNGATCYVGSADSADLTQYETWDTLWYLIGTDKDTDTLEDLLATLDKFPHEYKAVIEFIGTSLVEYFSQLRKAGHA